MRIVRGGNCRGIAVACAAAAWACVAMAADGKEEVDPGPSGPKQAQTAPLPVIAAAPAAPHIVIQGGSIPKDWSPKPVAVSAIGPDGRPLTVHVAPTYTFTYAIGPPVAAAMPMAPAPSRAVAARPVAAVPRSVPYGTPWVFQTQGLQPVDAGTLVAKPYTLPDPPSRWVAAPFPSNMANPATVAGSPQQFGGPLQPPPSQWVPAVGSPPDPATASVAAGPQAGEALASIAPAAIAGAAAAAAPQPIPTSPSSGSTVAQGASLSPSAAPQSPPLTPLSDDPRSLSNVRSWRVVGVSDGDTVTCLDESNTRQRVRLADIDAPEIGQDFGKVSRDALAELVFGKTVEVRDDGKDRYGRWIGRLSVDGTDVNREMVATGNAWQYAAYSKDESLAELQRQAQARKLGLWAQPSPTPPWEFRKNGGKPNATTGLDRRRGPGLPHGVASLAA